MRLRTDFDGLQHAHHGWLRVHLSYKVILTQQQTQTTHHLRRNGPHRTIVRPQGHKMRSKPSNIKTNLTRHHQEAPRQTPFQTSGLKVGNNFYLE